MEVSNCLPFKFLTDSEFSSEFIFEALPFSSYQDNFFDIRPSFDKFNEFHNPDIFHYFSVSGLNNACNYYDYDDLICLREGTHISALDHLSPLGRIPSYVPDQYCSHVVG